ncbi:MAG: hypothetical protein ABL999_00485 [Pyrinomonadaceae bacterium]
MAVRFPDIWLGDSRGHLADWVTQRWVQLSGKLIDVGDEQWLDGPIGNTDTIGDSYLSNYQTTKNQKEIGLIEDFQVLGSDVFDPNAIAPEIVDFYEHTAQYDLDVWSQWSGIFKPFGWLLNVIFSRRLQQMNMPISPLDTSKGMTSQVVPLTDDNGAHLGTGWLRKLISTGEIIYVGIYSHCRPPKFNGECIKVIFPLPNGSATVVMKPEAHEDGSLMLASVGNGFGDPGFYLIVRKKTLTAWIKYVKSLKETIHVYLDNGELRADHVLKLFGATFLRLHYRMRRRHGEI